MYLNLECISHTIGIWSNARWNHRARKINPFTFKTPMGYLDYATCPDLTTMGLTQLRPRKQLVHLLIPICIYPTLFSTGFDSPWQTRCQDRNDANRQGQDNKLCALEYGVALGCVKMSTTKIIFVSIKLIVQCLSNDLGYFRLHVPLTKRSVEVIRPSVFYVLLT